MTDRKTRILFLVTEDQAFLTHRLPMARAALSTGAEVFVAARVSGHAGAIRKAGFHLLPIAMKRGNKNPLRELLTVASLIKLMWRLKPDLVHNFGLKPVIDGGLAAIFAPVKHVIHTFTGMGAIFTNKREQRALRFIVTGILRFLTSRKGAAVTVQNHDDASLLTENHIVPADRITIIPGSGVNMRDFPAQPAPPGTKIIVTMVSRLLRDKGIGEFVAAAKLLAPSHPDVRFRVVGDPDTENPNSVAAETLAAWKNLEFLDFAGHRSDIAAIWAESHIAVLPSYREGMPKSMLEAAASARPLIVCQVPGCRELVRDDYNGLLVPARDPESLARAIESLIHDPDRRAAMGKNARKDVEARFSDPVIENSTRRLYENILHKQ